MNEFLSRHGSHLYAFDYFGLIVAVSLLECIIPRRPTAGSLRLRWLGNISLAIVTSATSRLVFPVIGFAFAKLSAERGWGLLNRISLPGWFEAAITLIALDGAIYVRHYLAHHVSFLWRLHRLHHTDEDVDFTTTLRAHPIDAILGIAVTLGVIAVLGAAPVAVLISQLWHLCGSARGRTRTDDPGSARVHRTKASDSSVDACAAISSGDRG